MHDGNKNGAAGLDREGCNGWLGIGTVDGREREKKARISGKVMN